MYQGSEKYRRVLDLLRKCKPVLGSAEDIEAEVMKKISGVPRTGIHFSDIIDFLFGWVYIGWVRRSLITASVALVIIFVYQQGIILKQISLLSRQVIVSDKENYSNPSNELDSRILMYRLSGRRFPFQKITISEKELNQFLESINELHDKYKDLLKLIEEDPDLKRYIEKKLEENKRKNIKL